MMIADTLDLQSHSSPAAQDHTATATNAQGVGASQAQALSNASADAPARRQMDKQEEDELERELADAEIAGDEGFDDDDDIMDKMSSSPSIIDGMICAGVVSGKGTDLGGCRGY